MSAKRKQLHASSESESCEDDDDDVLEVLEEMPKRKKKKKCSTNPKSSPTASCHEKKGKSDLTTNWRTKPINPALFIPHADTLGYMTSFQITPKQREALVSNLSKAQMQGLSELCRCVAYHEELDDEDRKGIEKHKEVIDQIAHPTTKTSVKRALATAAAKEKRGGFIGLLSGIVVPLLATAAKEAITAAIHHKKRR